MGTKLEELTALTSSTDLRDLVRVRGPVRCVAENHPGCQITCAGGECVALYHDPSGPCVSQCLGGAMQPIRLSKRFTLQLVANDGKPVAAVFGDELPDDLVRALRGLTKPVEIKGQFTFEAFIDRLREVVRAQGQSNDQSGFA